MPMTLRGKVVAWTVDGIVAHVIADRLNEFVGVAPRMLEAMGDIQSENEITRRV